MRRRPGTRVLLFSRRPAAHCTRPTPPTPPNCSGGRSEPSARSLSGAAGGAPAPAPAPAFARGRPTPSVASPPSGVRRTSPNGPVRTAHGCAFPWQAPEFRVPPHQSSVSVRVRAPPTHRASNAVTSGGTPLTAENKYRHQLLVDYEEVSSLRVHCVQATHPGSRYFQAGQRLAMFGNVSVWSRDPKA